MIETLRHYLQTALKKLQDTPAPQTDTAPPETPTSEEPGESGAGPLVETEALESAPLVRPWWVPGAIILMSSLTVLVLLMSQWEKEHKHQQATKFEQEQHQPSEVLKLIKFPRDQRVNKLQAIANRSEVTLDRSRARYLLAVDALDRYEGGAAVTLLADLELDYPVMAPSILLKRGRGYELSNEKIRAQETWQEIVEKYPDSPVAFIALELLGKVDANYWQTAITLYPKDPRLASILHHKLQQQPQSLELMRQILQVAPAHAQTPAVRDALLKKQAKKLTSEDWQAVADSFWHQGEYGQAIAAYQKAPISPQNLYRLGRSQQVSQQKQAAIATYQWLLKKYPKAPESATALKQLASLAPLKEAIGYLDRLQRDFPTEAADALLKKVGLLEKGVPASAEQARKMLLKQYSSSDAAAQLRWQQASKLAKAGKTTEAWQWAQQLAQENPESSLAPKAIFWIGKWAQRLQRSDDAKSAFNNVLARYPYSYYAWRSAVMLGWNVGDFNTVRFLQPTATLPDVRPIPPAGSSLFKELYRLGQDQAAIAIFESEIQQRQAKNNSQDLQVEEGFTQALLSLAQHQYLTGINQVFSLRDLVKTSQNQKSWQSLRKSADYWHALFPLPYQPLIFEWAAKRNLNPLLVASLIRQESRFEKKIQSPVGATGLMQVMPATAAWIAPQIKLKKYSLTNPKDNINLGTWYLDYTHRTYQNNSVLAIASYNAGPGNVAKWLKQFPSSDPDVFIEAIPFAETKGYVESVFGNYWNYLQLYDPSVQKLVTRTPQ